MGLAGVISNVPYLMYRTLYLMYQLTRGCGRGAGGQGLRATAWRRWGLSARRCGTRVGRAAAVRCEERPCVVDVGGPAGTGGAGVYTRW